MRRVIVLLVMMLTSVTIVPPFGRAPSPVRVRLSATESSVIARLQGIAVEWAADAPFPTNSVRWLVEDSALDSHTYLTGRRILLRARQILSSMEGGDRVPTWIVVGRTQAFLRRSVASLGCAPNLESSRGVYLMGLTTCNRRVIIINLTGYLFLRSLDQPITSGMETRIEPPLAATTYTIATRNIGALAHEWVHVARDKVTGGVVPFNEPSWFREGLPEVVAGLAMVRTYPKRADYREYHVVRIRRFMDWTSRCTAPLSAYRNGRVPGQCAYTRGAAAVELLLARHGGVARIVSLYRDTVLTGNFWSSFRRTYGTSVASFEREADSYARSIRYAAAN